MALLPVADAIEQILRGVEPLPAEGVALSDALGRVLAEDLIAQGNQDRAALYRELAPLPAERPTGGS